ncbi:hypothetical protein [Flavobacterium hydatis]|uniref:Lipoprotein n=1 Tax=Flavobacterium hydatis TaxID=991 RepID=A0A086ANZ8_FLAHY|nr:hypothetical protein [Flavobacterium hydatis]KFF18412.1 hypothetical protein IW20_05815 [Flavobacterium hydatis]OXA96840.1 hypothetical protein B0A62_06200 [Flavobacterium hydatis]
MKKYFFYLITLTLSVYSCSSVKGNLSPINAYLNSKLKNNDTIIVIENKINNNYAIDLLKEKSIAVVDSNTIENSVGLKPPLYNEKYWDIMNQKYRNKNTEVWLKSELWNQNDFSKAKIKFVKEKVFPKPSVYNEYMTDKKGEILVFSFSEPIFYKNEEYVIFSKSETTTKKQFILPNSIVIMKKENGEWIVFKEINDGNYY